MQVHVSLLSTANLKKSKIISPFVLTNSPESLFLSFSSHSPDLLFGSSRVLPSGDGYLGLQRYLAGRWPKVAWCLPSFLPEEYGTELYSGPFPLVV